MSPHHFSRMNKNSRHLRDQRDLEEKVDQLVKGAVAIIAAPFHAISHKKDEIDQDKR